MKNLKLFEDFGVTQGEPLALPLEQAVEKSMSGSKKSILLLTDGSGAREAAQVADDLGGLLIYVDAEFIPPDMFGLPEINSSDRTQTRIPTFMPYGESSSPIILLFSGVDKASGQVLNSIMNLATRRGVGNYTLPENCILVMSAAPDAEDHLSPAMMDRVILAK